MKATVTSQPQLRVIYIGGVEHNGSTLLGVALGNQSPIEYVGELTSLASQGWLGNEICTCGKTIAKCPYWGIVKDVWLQAAGGYIHSLAKLENEFDRHRRFFNLMGEKTIKSKSFTQYREFNLALYQAIQQVSGRDIIVDSSKRFSRALALSQVKDIDLRLIHLIRDARGVSYSWGKTTRTRRASWLGASLRWILTNAAFEVVEKKLDRSRWIRLRYEDLIRDPKATFNQLSEFTGVDLTNLADSLFQGVSLNKYHIGVGNGFLRREKLIKLSSTIEWPTRIPAAEQQNIWTLTGPLMKRYGYSR